MNQHPSVIFLQEQIATRPNKPEVLIICGSGLSGLSASVDANNKLVIPYASIPSFPQVTVQGHAGELVFGTISGIECMILRGRFHFYEGHTMETCVLPVRVAKTLGCKVMIVTNASGGMRTDFNVGDVAILSDHIGFPTLVGNGPLIGVNDPELGDRFPAMSNAYDLALQQLALRSAQALGLSEVIRTNATYCNVSGPQYESPAECRMLRMLGADCVGMSTVAEVIAANHCKMRILALSLITNKVVLPGEVNPKHATHTEVLETTAARSKDVQKLVELVLQDLHAVPPVVAADPAQATVKEEEKAQAPRSENVTKRLRELDISNTTPLEALRVLKELRQQVVDDEENSK